MMRLVMMMMHDESDDDADHPCHDDCHRSILCAPSVA